MEDMYGYRELFTDRLRLNLEHLDELTLLQSREEDRLKQYSVTSAGEQSVEHYLGVVTGEVSR